MGKGTVSWLEVGSKESRTGKSGLVVELAGGVRFSVGDERGGDPRGDGAAALGSWVVLSFTGGLRVFVAQEACDMRKGYEGLAGLVGVELKENVTSGALFLLGNRRRTRLRSTLGAEAAPSSHENRRIDRICGGEGGSISTLDDGDEFVGRALLVPQSGASHSSDSACCEFVFGG